MDNPNSTLPSALPVAPLPGETNWLEIVARQVKALKFGSVQITVHEGRVTQVDTSIRVRSEKTR